MSEFGFRFPTASDVLPEIADRVSSSTSKRKRIPVFVLQRKKLLAKMFAVSSRSRYVFTRFIYHTRVNIHVL